MTQTSTISTMTDRSLHQYFSVCLLMSDGLWQTVRVRALTPSSALDVIIRRGYAYSEAIIKDHRGRTVATYVKLCGNRA